MKLAELLAIRPGVTAVVGGGGKTALLRALGEELAGTVLLCTTTKIFPFPELPCARNAAELDRLRAANRLLCAGRNVPGSGKLGPPDVPMAALAARFDYVLIEADGAAGRPLKAHAPHEPAIPPEAARTILVVGASGFGRPIREAAHRPERYARLAGAGMDDIATPRTQAAVLRAEGLHDLVYVNQAETPEAAAAARALAAYLDGPVLAGSLRRGEFFKCW